LGRRRIVTVLEVYRRVTMHLRHSRVTIPEMNNRRIVMLEMLHQLVCLRMPHQLVGLRRTIPHHLVPLMFKNKERDVPL
jgi:hypothetical protein